MTSEYQIEEKLIQKLVDLKYNYRDDIRTRQALEKNFRDKFQALNKVTLTDTEFAKLRDEIVTSDVFTAAKTLRQLNTFIREDGTPLHYTLVNIKDWCKNDFEVINQLRINTENSNHRYDVILLINGIPVVQIELKTLHISPKKAMEQIVKYKNDPGNGYTNSILCFMQLFIVSNENKTLYFSNNQNQHFTFNADERFLPVYQLADEKNNKINHLYDFANDFLAKCTLGQLISRYMVLIQSKQEIRIMRPYQIYAVKAIVDCIHQNRGNGYIWHTTGSGKTLTSFKTSTLLKDNPDIEKCLFVVDRKDLDRQTRDEFNKFQEKCVEENTNTETLINRMLSDDYSNKVIVTTIQKLGIALDEDSKRNKENIEKGKLTFKERLKPLRNKRIVFIFDECHRSQFGDNHDRIKEFFPNAQMFGFTGTPIFEDNATYKKIEGDLESYKTTEYIFEKELHSYTITNAINDRNVLGFHIDYFKPENGKSINTGDTASKKAVVEAILDKHNSATNSRRFNAIFATSSINDAIEYYDLFKTKQRQKQAEEENYKPLNIACVFSPPAQGSTDKNNSDIKQLQEDLPQERADNQVNPEEKKAALTNIINDYNLQYGTNESINDFDHYYKDVQQRIKDQEYPNKDYPHDKKIDIVIVVDMLLTGFDSKYLNTLYVDKNFKYHGLIQAFSRTNRVLNDTKPWGNILDFRSQEEAVKEAIKLFSGENEEKAKKIWLVDEAPKVIEDLQTAVNNLDSFMKSQKLENKPYEVPNIKGSSAKSRFVNYFKEIQKLKTKLEQYTDLSDENKDKVEKMMPEDTMRAFKSMYLDVAQELKVLQDQGSHEDQEIQQLDFEFVLFSTANIDYDYIMGLISSFTKKSNKQTVTREQLIELIKSDSNFLDEREDIISYINTLEVNKELNEKEVHEGYQKFKAQKANKEIEDIAVKHDIDFKSLKDFIDLTMSRFIFDGEQLSDLFAPLELGWKARVKKEVELMEDLVPMLKKLAQGREISGLSAYE